MGGPPRAPRESFEPELPTKKVTGDANAMSRPRAVAQSRSHAPGEMDPSPSEIEVGVAIARRHLGCRVVSAGVYSDNGPGTSCPPVVSLLWLASPSESNARGAERGANRLGGFRPPSWQMSQQPSRSSVMQAPRVPVNRQRPHRHEDGAARETAAQASTAALRAAALMASGRGLGRERPPS